MSIRPRRSPTDSCAPPIPASSVATRNGAVRHRPHQHVRDLGINEAKSRTCLAPCRPAASRSAVPVSRRAPGRELVASVENNGHVLPRDPNCPIGVEFSETAHVAAVSVDPSPSTVEEPRRTDAASRFGKDRRLWSIRREPSWHSKIRAPADPRACTMLRMAFVAKW